MTFIYSNDTIGENFENKLNKITSLSRRSTAPHTRERPSKKEKLENTVKVLKNLFSITNLFSNSYVMMLVIVSNSLEMMLENSINLMVQPEFSPVNCPLSSAFANICHSNHYCQRCH